ncbi:HNH endonuclease [Lysinibacter cavernae]|uniref:HNH endonuclease n=1 Tax=Lysinibacter cavernae TaxID=1640652 RepID=UPI003616ABBE
MTARWGRRCTRTAQHGDHFFPWTKGGATSMRNYVAACAKCNLSKSSKTPTRLEKFRIEHRRRKYFGNAVDRTVGEWVQVR